MTWIEGVGDEVIQFFILLFILMIALVAWWSTSISDRPLIRTVLILERRSTRRTVSDTQTVEENSEPGNQPVEEDKEESSTAEPVQVAEQANEEVDSAPAPVPIPIPIPKPIHNTEPPPEPIPPAEPHNAEQETNNVLRNRRLAFFVQSSPSSSATDVQQQNEELKELIEPSVPPLEVQEEEPPEQEDVEVPLEDGHIRIRLKYLNDDQKLVEGNLQEQLGDFKRRHFSLELSARKLVRLIFNGQVLQHDSRTLQNYGLFDNCVVHCLVHQPRTPPPTAEARNNAQTNNARAGVREWDLGNVLLASVSLLLGLAWYGRYQYAQWYSATATVALVGLTGIFTVSLIGMYLPDTDGVRQH